MSNENAIAELREIPEFREFARQKMSTNPERWRKEAANGVGFARQLAEPIVAVAGGGTRDP